MIPLPPPPMMRKKNKICAFWKEGRCSKGAGCEYSHGEEDMMLQVQLLQDSRGPTPGSMQMQGQYGGHEGGGGMDPPMPMAGRPGPNVAGARYKTRLCSFFQEGRCKNGDACQWAHGELELGTPIDGVGSTNTQLGMGGMGGGMGSLMGGGPPPPTYYMGGMGGQSLGDYGAQMSMANVGMDQYAANHYANQAAALSDPLMRQKVVAELAREVQNNHDNFDGPFARSLLQNLGPHGFFDLIGGQGGVNGGGGVMPQMAGAIVSEQQQQQQQKASNYQQVMGALHSAAASNQGTLNAQQMASLASMFGGGAGNNSSAMGMAGIPPAPVKGAQQTEALLNLKSMSLDLQIKAKEVKILADELSDKSRGFGKVEQAFADLKDATEKVETEAKKAAKIVQWILEEGDWS